MANDNEILSPEDIMLDQQADTYVPQPKKTVLELDDIKEKFKEEFKDKKEKPPFWALMGPDAGRIYLAGKEAEKKAKESPNPVVKVSPTKFIDVNTGKNLYAGTGDKEIANAAIYGLLEAGYGLGQLLTIGTDYALDTNTTEKLDKAYDKIKNLIGIEEPDDVYEQFTKTAIEYGVPFGLIGKVGKPLRLFLRSQSSKIGNKALRYGTKAGISIGYNAATFSAAEFIVGNKGDTVNNIKYEDEEGKTGRELAVARIKNKLRFGFEGAKIGAAFGVAGRALPLGVRFGLKATGATLNFGARAANTLVFAPAAYLLTKVDPGIIPAVSKAVRSGSQFTVDSLMSPVYRGLEFTKAAPFVQFKNKGELPPFEEWNLFSVNDSNPLKARLKKIDNFFALFRKEYQTPKSIYEASQKAERAISADNKTAEQYLTQVERLAYDLAKKQEEAFNAGTSSPLTEEYILDLVEQYLKGQTKLAKLPKEMQVVAKDLKNHLDKKKSEFLDLLPDTEFKDLLSKNINTYLRKSYSILHNPTYNPSPEVMDQAIKAGTKIVVKNKDMKEQAIKMFPELSKQEAYKAFSEAMMKDILINLKTVHKDPIQMLQFISNNYLRSEGKIITGEELPVFMKKLLGDKSNLRYSVLTTMSDMITQTSNKKLYDEIAELGLKSGLIKKERGVLRQGQYEFEPIGRIPGLGNMYSDLSQYYARPELAEAIRGSKGILDGMLQSQLYRNFLQYKTLVQYGKTVLSPETQIRNVISTPVFPLSYGWIGGKGTINDSFKVMFDDIYGAGKSFNNKKFIEDINEMVKLGVLDESVIAKELMTVVKKMQEGALVGAESTKGWAALKKVGLPVDDVYKWIIDNKFIDKATRTYQGGDNVWKHFSYIWNYNTLNNIFKGDLKELIKQYELISGQKYNPVSIITGNTKTYDQAVKEFSTWYVRSLMPTYSEIPQIVKIARLTPLGNFIAWPSEIMRLTGRGMITALREMASDNIAIRQMGNRKLIGMFTTWGGAGYATVKLSEALTGVTQEQMEAYQRSFTQDYEKNSSISPVSGIKDGVFKVINNSYSDVWDFTKAPMRAVISELGKIDFSKPSEIDDHVINAVINGFKPLFEPFLTQAIGLEPFLDVTPKTMGGRGGVTKNDRMIYSPTDSGPMKLSKSIGHVIQTVFPGVVVTVDKYGNFIYDLYKGREYTGELQDKIISLLSGSKIKQVDLENELDMKVGQFAKLIKSGPTQSEPFYSFKDWQSRGPRVMANEYNQIQQEAFSVQQELRQLVKDAKTLNIPDYKIYDMIYNRTRSKELATNLVYSGLFTPHPYYEKLLEKKWEKAKREENLAGRETPSYSFVVPIGELEKVKSNYYGIYLDESLNKQLIEKEKRFQQYQKKSEVIPQGEGIVSKPQTQPLPEQPQPTAVAQAPAAQFNPITKLTSTEQALLSPDEQAIRQRQRA